MKNRVEELLSKGVILGFLGLIVKNGFPLPHLFTNVNRCDLEFLSIEESRYPLVKIFLKLISKYQDQKFGIMVRGCDERAIIELAKLNQINLNNVVMLGVACSEEMAKKCLCKIPYPSQFVFGERINSSYNKGGLKEEIERMSIEERENFWKNQFKKCFKCYGCRNVCPICICIKCCLEDQDLIKKGEIPPEFPVYHLVRAIDVAGRCIDCGLCEEVCPANIPLRAIHKKVLEIFETVFSYEPGRSLEEMCPLNFPGEISSKELKTKSD